MTWLKEVRRNMEFLESELPMLDDREFATRYYTAAEQEALEGMLVPYGKIARAMEKSRKQDDQDLGGEEDASETSETVAEVCLLLPADDHNSSF
jgi:hypothetical protein